MRTLLLYADPGSGMMLLQVLLATLAGAGFYFRNFFLRIFGRKAEVEIADVVPAVETDRK